MAVNGWIRQAKEAYNGDTLTCPACGSQNTKVDFYVFEDGVGYCDFICHDCGDKFHVSRIKYPADIKITPVLIR